MNKLVLLLLIFGSLNSFAQTMDENQIQQVLELQLQELNWSDEGDLDVWLQDLRVYAENPLNLNEASELELRQLVFLSSQQIIQLLIYRDQYGELLSLFELMYIPGFDHATIANILPFVTIEQKSTSSWSLRSAWKYGRSELVIRSVHRVEKSEAYRTQRYAGNRYKHFLRYRYTYGKHLSLGFLLEKDAGEKLDWKSNHFGIHFAIRNWHFVEKLILGDFHAQFGQGLALWSGYGRRKSSGQTFGLGRSGRGFKVHAGAEELRYFRGVATTFRFKPIRLSIAYSNKRRDATLGERSLVFKNSGLHRTENELETKNRVGEELLMIGIDARIKQLRLGLLGLQLTHKSNLPRPIHQQRAAGYFEYAFGSGHYFGEFAMAGSKNYSLVLGANQHLHQQLKLSILYRYYPETYQGEHINTWSEKSNGRNEEGVYFGVELLPIKRVQMQAYADAYRSIAPSFSSGELQSGLDLSFRATVLTSASSKFIVLYRNERQDRIYIIEDQSLMSTLQDLNQSWRLQWLLDLNSRIQLQTRYEYKLNLTRHIESKGELLFQDLRFRCWKGRLVLSFRYALFNTDDYNSRIYAYENDLRYQFSVPAYAYQGNRIYLLCRVKPTPNLSIEIKYGQTHLNNRNHHGSGWDQTEGPLKSEWKVQLIGKW